MSVCEAGGQEDTGEPGEEAGDGGATRKQAQRRHPDQVAADPADGRQNTGEYCLNTTLILVYTAQILVSTALILVYTAQIPMSTALILP